jgi:predicted CopG family antitoxin
MPTKTVRIHDDTHESLKRLAEKTGEPMPELLSKAVEEYRRKHFLEGLAEDFARLRADSDKWKEELEEREAWNETLQDDLVEE